MDTPPPPQTSISVLYASPQDSSLKVSATASLRHLSTCEFPNKNKTKKRTKPKNSQNCMEAHRRAKPPKANPSQTP